MRKVISILFLLLTSIAVMVHAVVPHHHHSKIFTYVVGSLGKDTRSLFNHHDARFAHHIVDTTVFTYHVLQKTVDIPSLQACPVNDDILCPSDYQSGIPIDLKPYPAFGYSTVIINSLGLRAPPRYFFS